MMRRLTLELLLIVRGWAVAGGVAALLAAGMLALAHGETVIGRQLQAIGESPARQVEEHQHILGPLAPTAAAGDQLYYLKFHTVRVPSPWAEAVVGQRDIQPFNLKVRILALQGQLYDSDLGNPLLATFGNFDLAFVLVVLSPLLIIALTYNVHAGEVEGGTWSLLRAQPVRVGRLMVVRFALRGLLVWLPLLALQLAATAWLDLPVDGAWWRVAAWTAGYVAFWVALAALLALLRRSSDVNVLVLLGCWVVGTALGPALLNVVAAARHPLPEALELTVQQRQGYHGAWDEPLPEVMEAFYRRYPEWRTVEIPRDRYSNGWYYAMQQRGDDAARDAAARYRAALEGRDRWVASMSWLFPPAAFQRALASVARTDLAGHLAYLDSVAEYHERLKRHFFPVVFRETPVADVNWGAVPAHRHVD